MTFIVVKRGFDDDTGEHTDEFKKVRVPWTEVSTLPIWTLKNIATRRRGVVRVDGGRMEIWDRILMKKS